VPLRSLPFRLLAPTLAAATIATTLVATATPSAAAVTIDGPDVSSYQHPSGASINWAKVAAAGHEFAIVKATEGTWYVNRYFRGDYTAVRRAGMVRGSYHFAQPSRPVARSAAAQAAFYVSHLGNVATSRTLPPALDLEVDGGLSRTDLITWAQDFLLDVRTLTGRTPMIYTYPWFWRSALGDPSAFARYPLWMAAYRGSTPDAGTTLWQYTSAAKVSGIRGGVDMSRLLADPATFGALADGTVATAWPATPPAAPVAVTATPTVAGATVSWLPPDAGSSRITSYAVTVAPADGSAPAMTQKVGAAHAVATFTGLQPGVPYVAGVVARNAAGTSAAATALAPVVPQTATQMTVTAPRLVSYGTQAEVDGVLTRADTGLPLAGATVVVATRPAGSAAWTSAGVATTDVDGHVAQLLTPDRNVDVRLTYAGDIGLAPAVAVVSVRVRKVVAAALSSATTTVGLPVTVRGRVRPVEARVRVTLQQRVAGRWRGLQSRRTGRYGGFLFTITPTATGSSRYRIAAAATAARAAGWSPALTLTTT
jgi:lysozyme